MAHLDECCPGLPSSPVVCDAPADPCAAHPGWTSEPAAPS
jgi:hypothetical protein